MKVLKNCFISVKLLFCLHGIATAGTLSIASWPDYYPPELLKKFEQDTGIKTVLDNYESDAMLAIKLKSGGRYDVVVTSDIYVTILKQDNLLMKLNKDRLPNFKNIKSEYRSPPFDPARDYAMPYTLVLTGFIYDSARVPAGKLEDSWRSFFNPDKTLHDKIANLDERDDLYMAASWYLGQDECSESLEDAKRVLNVLQKQNPHVLTYSNNGPIERMVNKEVIVQQIWNGAAVRVRPKLASAIFVYPKEGIRLAMDNFVVPAKAKNVDEAYRFIDWMLKPENIAQVSNKYKYDNAIIGAEKYMDPDLINDPAFSIPKEFRNRIKLFKLCSPKALALRNKVWMQLKKSGGS
ncbi:extracellular solute-binding protein [Mycoavidus sp. B2-EB]|uniref:extracellular solute-binding protein n=1 Tax=Mycoavidus sp. B2-EB TaxID=2651972 RepID=UPI00162678FE|nr:extracellular solute-binding protein [Mycoavidus sp. B2-EB]BBO59825.1 putrescine-binding periplasmic protein [Mycoavidus sp. B2-EB]